MYGYVKLDYDGETNKKVFMNYSATISGGGIKGAYSLGALLYCFEKNIKFKVITGTSIGSILGALYAQGDITQAHDIIISLKSRHDIFNFRKPVIHSPEWLHRLSRLFLSISLLRGIKKKGLIKPGPIVEKLYNLLDEDKLIQSDTRFISCSTNLNTLKEFYLKAEEQNRGMIIKFIKASSSIPILFPPVRWDGYDYINGGLKEIIPVEKVVEEHPDSEKIFIFVSGTESPTPIKNIPNLVNFSARTINTVFDNNLRKSLYKGTTKFWDSDKFIVIKPDEGVLESDFDINPYRIRKAIEIGYEHARKVLDERL